MTHLTTTLAEIRATHPCEGGWTKLLRHLSKTHAEAKTDTAELPLSSILDSNGLDGALWVLDNVIRNHRIAVLFSADCAERVLPVFERERPGDDRPRRAIEMARDQTERAACAAAWDAARDAAWAALDAAWDAARDAAWAAACAAERAACAAERAACTAAGAVAWDAAGDAAWAAWDAAWDADRAAAWAAAWDAAWDAERDAQTARLRQYLEHGEAAAAMPWPEVAGVEA